MPRNRPARDAAGTSDVFIPFSRLALAGMSDLVLFLDVNRCIVWANLAAGRVAGGSPASLEGKKCHQVWSGRDEPCPGCPLELVPAAEQIPVFEKTFPDQRIRLVSVYPVYGHDGMLGGYIEVCKDVTSLAEQEKQTRELERMAGVLEMAGAVCHEISQPLQGARSFLDLLMSDSAMSPEQKRRLANLSEELERACDITAKVQRISKYRTKEYLGKTRIIDLDSAADELGNEKD